MSRRRVATFRLDDGLIEGLQVVWEREGITPSEQVRRAIERWLADKGLLVVRQRRRLRAQAGPDVWDRFAASLGGTHKGTRTDVLVPADMHDDAPAGRPFRELTEAELDRLLAIGREFKRPVSHVRRLWKESRP